MQVLVNTDNHIDGTDGLSGHVESVVEDAVGRFKSQITRVEVHLNDTNAHKSGATDKRCMMEARPAGMAPIAVTHNASSLHEAIDGAADKLERALEHAIGRLEDNKGRMPFGGEPDL